MTYQCLSCHKQFEKSHRGECPYCGSERLEEEKDAAGLIGEVEDILGK